MIRSAPKVATLIGTRMGLCPMLSQIAMRLWFRAICAGQKFAVAPLFNSLSIDHGSPHLADRIVQQPQSIENDKDGAALMTQHRQRQRQFKEGCSDDQNEHRADGEDKILTDDRRGVPGK